MHGNYQWKLQSLLTTIVYSFLHYHLSCQVAELSERLSAIMMMKCSRKLLRSGWRGQTEDFYFSGIYSLPEKCHKCIELSRGYIEK